MDLNYSFSNEFQKMVHEKNWGAKLVGSFTVEVGDQDEASKCRFKNSLVFVQILFMQNI